MAITEPSLGGFPGVLESLIYDGARRSFKGGATIIAFGDNYNDIEMIEYADIGVAMGNGPQDLKQIADLVTRSVEDNGVYYGLKTLGFV